MKQTLIISLFSFSLVYFCSCNQSEKNVEKTQNDSIEIADVKDESVVNTFIDSERKTLLVVSPEVSTFEAEKPPIILDGEYKFDADYKPTYYYSIKNNSDKSIIAFEFGYLNGESFKRFHEEVNLGEMVGGRIISFKKVKQRIVPFSKFSSTLQVTDEIARNEYLDIISYIYEDGTIVERTPEVNESQKILDALIDKSKTY